MSTSIQLQCTGHLLQVTGKSKLSSGSRETDYVQVVFDDSWDGYSKLMVFANSPDEAFRVVVDGLGRAAIPYEVLAQPGRLFMGVYGTKNDKVMTSEFIEYPIYPGAPGQSIDPEPVPSQTVIDQLLQLVGDNTWFNAHAIRHASGGLDPLTPADIGAIPTNQKGAANGVASLNSHGQVVADQARSLVYSLTASRNIASSDAGRFLWCLTNNITLTVPAGLPTGMEVEIYRGGTPTVTIQGASGVTIRSVTGGNRIAHQNGIVALKRISSTSEIWVLSGDVE